MTHELKTWPEYYEAIITGRKKFEVRINDRNFQVGDRLLLQEWNPQTKEYTGRYTARKITYIMREGNEFLSLGESVIMSIR